MTKPRPAPFLIADHPALDFLNTTASPWGKQIEWLSNGSDLLDWLECAGMINTETLRDLRSREDFDSLDKIAQQARELREWFRQFVSHHAGHRIVSSAITELESLNDLLARDVAFLQIEADGTHNNKVSELVCKKHRRWNQPQYLLQPLAEAICECVCNVDFALVRRCENPSCTLWFYDTTKSHIRRWCSMSVCGNRSKASAYRARTKQMLSGESATRKVLKKSD